MTADSKFKSGFAKELDDNIAFKRQCGYAYRKSVWILAKFDSFCAFRGITNPVFTKADADAWMARLDEEACTSYYNRINAIKNFLNRLVLLGYDVQTIRDVRFKPTGFQLHIYSPEETKRYFEAVDGFSSNSPKEAIELPVLFRILYCWGTRLTETLCIKKQDVDLKEGAIHLRNTKGGRGRVVVVGEDLRKLLCRYADKCFVNGTYKVAKIC